MIKKGNQVEILCGKDKGKKGEIIEILISKNKAKVMMGSVDTYNIGNEHKDKG